MYNVSLAFGEKNEMNELQEFFSFIVLEHVPEAVTHIKIP